MQTRRRFLRTLSLAGAASFFEMARSPAAEDALETTVIRLARNAGVCMAPRYVAEGLLLRAEGFAEVRYIDLVTSAAGVEALGRGLVHPVATKRVLRAILRAADLCAGEPARVAQRVIDGAYADRYAFALETLSELLYKWREYDDADTVWFYARRLQEAGLGK